jgi:hypothetical protein
MAESGLHRRGYSKEPSTDPRKGIDTQRGRYALGWLIDQDGRANIETWAYHVAAWEEDVPLCDVSEERWMHYYSWLYFSLVPRLVQEGLVEHRNDAVRPVDGLEPIGEYLMDLSPTEE